MAERTEVDRKKAEEIVERHYRVGDKEYLKTRIKDALTNAREEGRVEGCKEMKEKCDNRVCD